MKNNIKTLWSDRKRYFGMPISFTKYYMSEDRLFVQKGLFNITIEEVLLYRVKDLSLKLSFGNRLFGCGSIEVKSNDQSCPHITIASIKNPIVVKELIHGAVEASKENKHIIINEGDDHDCNH